MAQNNNMKHMLLSDNSSFAVKEAYKTLRTNVSFSLPGSGCKCIGVTSPSRGDGKSSISVNLAISFAQINKKVIILDCDMRLPTIAKKIGIESTPGLSNFLVGSNSEAIIRSVKEFGIDVLTSGNIPPDPTTLLESEQFAKLLEILKKNYDYIIIDLPPLSLVTDAAIISKYIDGYLIVVRHNYSEFNKVKDVLYQLEFADAKILGFVYNGKQMETHRYKRKINNDYYNYYNNKSGNSSEESDERK